MSEGRLYTALGLMSGTSMDGVDAALLITDGGSRIIPGDHLTLAYDGGLRRRLAAALGREDRDAPELRALGAALADRHAEAALRLLARSGAESGVLAPEVVGFHGHTITHAPARGVTVQLGDGARLAARLRLPVVADFRSRDIAGGGQGAPLAPLYHAALALPLERPLCVLNIGGVANLTWVGGGEDGAEPALLAFDTGPGNALIDDWLRRHTGRAFDAGGAMAAGGRVVEAALAALLADPYFARPPPKSLDRQAFAERAAAILGAARGLDVADGAATLAAFTAAAVAAAVRHLPHRSHLPCRPLSWIVTGGGRHNKYLMQCLKERLQCMVIPCENVGWDGDALEAQAFAYLAVRHMRGGPLSLPSTTGVAAPCPGGVLYQPGQG